MATLAEFTTGFMLVHRLDPDHYRIIMQSMHMDYQYQGRKDAVARYAIDDTWLEKHVLQPLQHQDATVCTCRATILDSDGEHLAEGTVNWQIKPWTKVRTAPQK